MVAGFLMIKSPAAAVCALAVPFAVAAVLAAQPAPPPASPQRALLNQYCVGCHNQRAKAAGQEAARKLTLDDVDVANVSEHAETWELVVRKMRAGMMPPANARRPDKAAYGGFITWLE